MLQQSLALHGGEPLSHLLCQELLQEVEVDARGARKDAQRLKQQPQLGVVLAQQRQKALKHQEHNLTNLMDGAPAEYIPSHS